MAFASTGDSSSTSCSTAISTSGTASTCNVAIAGVGAAASPGAGGGAGAEAAAVSGVKGAAAGATGAAAGAGAGAARARATAGATGAAATVGAGAAVAAAAAGAAAGTGVAAAAGTSIDMSAFDFTELCCTRRPVMSPASSASNSRAAAEVARRAVHVNLPTDGAGSGGVSIAYERIGSSCGSSLRRSTVNRSVSISSLHASHVARCSWTSRLSDALTSPSI